MKILNKDNAQLLGLLALGMVVTATVYLTLPIAKARGFCSVPVFSNLDRFGFKFLSEVKIMDEVLLSRLL